MADRETTAVSAANRDLVEGAQEVDAVRDVIIKAHVLGGDRVQASGAIQAIEANERIFTQSGALPPPFDPDALCVLLENSSLSRCPPAPARPGSRSYASCALSPGSNAWSTSPRSELYQRRSSET